MSQKFRYLDSDGKIKEAEAFVVSDHTSTMGSPNSPIITNESGYINPSLIPSGISKAAVKYEKFILSQLQIDEKKVVLSETPIYPLSLLLIPDGGTFQRNGIDFNLINDNELSWQISDLSTIFAKDDEITVVYYYSAANESTFYPVFEEIMLTEIDLLNGYVYLQNTPIFESSLILIPDGSIPQTAGTAFSVDAANKKIILNDLLPLLEADSVLRVMYYQ